jgi:hypothetical protein
MNTSFHTPGKMGFGIPVKLLESFLRATNMLNKMSGSHQIILEDQAQDFAEMAKKQVSDRNSNTSESAGNVTARLFQH